MRILIRYPEENASAKLRPVLYHSRGRDPHPDTGDFPGSGDRGIHVGSSVDFAPDDGLFDEAFSIESGVKLKVEDFDIIEAEIDIGTINYVGGAVGPGTVTMKMDSTSTQMTTMEWTCAVISIQSRPRVWSLTSDTRSSH